MNDGVLRGTGSGAKGVGTPCVWQLIEVTQTIPFLNHAKYATFYIFGGGGGGGSGRLAAAANAGGGGGGSGGGVRVHYRVPVQFYFAYGASRITCTIGSGGTGGAAPTADLSSNAGTGGGTSSVAFNPYAGANTSTAYNATMYGGSSGGGTAGGTGNAGGGSPGNPLGGYGGATGGTGTITQGAQCVGPTQAFPSLFGMVGGAGGSGKNVQQGCITQPPFYFGDPNYSANNVGYGLSGVDSEVFGRMAWNWIMSQKSPPDPLVHWWQYGGGGGATGGETATSGAGGAGGAGFRGTGGGGGGGAAATAGGAGGRGGNGAILICWEFE